jgi:hydroxymethylbilane synthase
MKQAEMVADALRAHHAGVEIDIIGIKSAADWKKQDGEKSLSEQAGGKGQFAKEIEEAHLNGEIDFGVHSAKDMPSFLPEGLQIAHYLPRADARDAFIGRTYNSLSGLPEGAVLGTCSPRRQSLALSRRPDLQVVPFRGNVRTRLKKVEDGQVDATFLAMAGLQRLGIEDDMIHPLSIEEMLPACGQGAVCIETTVGDEEVHQLLRPVTCTLTQWCVSAEREVLKMLDGSCHTPIAAYARLEKGYLSLKAAVGSLDGRRVYREEMEGECLSLADAIALGQRVGKILKKTVPEDILDHA